MNMLHERPMRQPLFVLPISVLLFFLGISHHAIWQLDIPPDQMYAFFRKGRKVQCHET